MNSITENLLIRIADLERKVGELQDVIARKDHYIAEVANDAIKEAVSETQRTFENIILGGKEFITGVYEVKLQKVVGLKGPYMGMCNNVVKIGNIFIEFMEDESDGWRSYIYDFVRVSLGSHRDFTGGNVVISEEVEIQEFEGNLSSIVLEESRSSSFKGVILCDTKTDEVLVAAGTDNTDEDYPSCLIAQYIFNF